jgi:hypothetical protein
VHFRRRSSSPSPAIVVFVRHVSCRVRAASRQPRELGTSPTGQRRGHPARREARRTHARHTGSHWSVRPTLVSFTF